MGSGQFDKAGVLAADFSGLEAASPGFTVRFPRSAFVNLKGYMSTGGHN